MLRGQRRRVAHRLDGLEAEQGIAVDRVVQVTAAHRKAGDDLAAVLRLRAPGQHALLDQGQQRVGDDVGVHAQVAAVADVLKRLVRDAAQADLQRGAVLDGAGDVAADALDHLGRDPCRAGIR